MEAAENRRNQEDKSGKHGAQCYVVLWREEEKEMSITKDIIIGLAVLVLLSGALIAAVVPVAVEILKKEGNE